jgi:hypothetical protein
MNVQDAFYGTCHDYPGGCDALALRLTQAGYRMSGAVLRNKANPHNGSNVPTLADTDHVMGITGDYRVLHALAGNHGHIAVKVEADAQPCDLAVLEMVTHVWRTHGSVGTAVDAVLADHHVELHELPAVRQAIYRHQQALQQMLVRLEALAGVPSKRGRRS